MHLVAQPVGIRSDIFTALAEIYALQGEKQQTYTAIGQAKDAYPNHPRSDSSYFYADSPVNLLHQAEAEAFLHLHQPRRALEALQASNKEPLTGRGRCEHFIRQAEAGRQCHDLELFRSSLIEGSLLATALGSSHRLQSALQVYNQAPRDWKENAQVKWLSATILSFPERTGKY
ncbi:hypothetical protein [Ktedonobacter sp. SOSP1-52]|uniref:hypothetical protein n=1 Tax=Ktedonobacter sp. SOSP1-52 TaxID=2778366 RepID=UPI0019153610|nr:hypothetical protein [Ktedonobacter sp. SOSP1-52]